MAEPISCVSPTGALIIGTLARLTGCEEIYGIDPETGEPAYEGRTEIFYDDQETVTREPESVKPGCDPYYARFVYLAEIPRCLK